METLQLKGVITLPPMRIDLHVYSEVPAERFVFVNMKKQTEGSQLPEGPRLKPLLRKELPCFGRGNVCDVEKLVGVSGSLTFL